MDGCIPTGGRHTPVCAGARPNRGRAEGRGPRPHQNAHGKTRGARPRTHAALSPVPRRLLGGLAMRLVLQRADRGAHEGSLLRGAVSTAPVAARKLLLVLVFVEFLRPQRDQRVPVHGEDVSPLQQPDGHDDRPVLRVTVCRASHLQLSSGADENCHVHFPVRIAHVPHGGSAGVRCVRVCKVHGMGRGRRVAGGGGLSPNSTVQVAGSHSTPPSLQSKSKRPFAACFASFAWFHILCHNPASAATVCNGARPKWGPACCGGSGGRCVRVRLLPHRRQSPVATTPAGLRAQRGIPCPPSILSM